LLVLQTTGTGSSSLRFRHDRVQQAVHASLTGVEERARHLALARRLCRCGPEFEGVAAEQYQAVVSELDDPGERERAAELFERAAAQAGRVANHGVAERYLASGIILLDGFSSGTETPEPGTETPEPGTGAVAQLRLRLQVARHAVLCALNRFEAADEVFAWVQAHAEDPLARAEVTVVQVGGLIHRGQLGEAIGLGSAAMADLGDPIPAGPDLDAQTAAGLQRLRVWAG
jgi:predicted ATPase